MHPAEQSSPRMQAWFQKNLVLSLIGACLSWYAIQHYHQVKLQGHTDAVCNINPTFNCDQMAVSVYGELGGLPLGVWGLGYFLSVLCFNLLGWWRPKQRSEQIQSHGCAALLGSLVSVYLLGVSVFHLHTYCIVCLGVYLVCFAMAGLIFYHRQDIPRPFRLSHIASGALTGGLVLIATMVGYNMMGFSQESSLSSSSQVTSKEAPPVSSPAPTQLGAQAKAITINKSSYSGFGEDYRWGAEDAKVTVVMFSDFECIGCGGMSHVIDEIAKELSDRVLFVYKNFPLDRSCNNAIATNYHTFACKAAVIARCAGEQGKFHEFYVKAFAEQQNISDLAIQGWAESVGLSQTQVDRCLKNQGILAKIKDDIALGEQLGVDVTPTIFIQGHRFLGRPDRLQDEIEKALNP